MILLDINMPKMNGIDFLYELRKDPELRSISIFILSYSNDERDLVAAYDLNVAGYIVKPTDYTKFVETIESINKFWNLCERPMPISQSQ